jgi:choline dehydrogenase
MTRFDYVIVGAGPAGCVLANRLSADPAVSVLLVEAGGEDSSPLISMPRGFGALLGDPAFAWHYPTRPFGPSQRVEHWIRGRTLGGSSAVNGLVYNRGNRADYEALEALGNPGWGWDEMLKAFEAVEANGLEVSTVDGTDPLLEDVIAAGGELGWRRVRDLNASDDERIGYATATIRDGRRVTAADAFLHPVRDRPNLTVAVDTVVDRVALDDGRAVGVRGRGFEADAAREVILATGSIATPRILQLSGIGPAETLRSAGVDVVADSPNVGGRMREHLAFMVQFRLSEDLGYNRPLADGSAAQEYEALGTGPLSTPSFDIVAFFKTRSELDRPDAQIQVAPFSMRPLEPGGPLELEREPGMLCVGYVLRPDSEGAIRLTSADPGAPLDIDANYYDTEHDRETSVDVFRGIRRLFGTEPLAGRIERETIPGDGVQDDGEIVEAGLTLGGCGYHAIGTCAMGPADDDVVDPELRVRGVESLRVVDASVLPVMVSGNLNGPVSALAWRAADFILDG